MGTQGDAGQFRTPRHIIDFIAEVVNPQKHETILDPACGTAGFLISAYKHILKENTDNSHLERGGSAKQKRGVLLTPTERKRMLMNFSGYDISPDMVRLSLVNLYLHGFQDPKIYEYDTLTSEERWDETVDVILANPPFMTPKGGIRPHKRFSVQAKRSEVLFVDYIAEHLNPGGRAGVIVPEGIIFQSSNAYKDLRKMLVEDYLWAVVSLPAGVFQPYSGVKTSILLMDKTKAKNSDSVLFVKIENDGFDLGAQRRPIDKNDLPEALRILNMESINRVDGELTPQDALQQGRRSIQSKEMAHWVEKSKIEESGDWNLSGERYRESLIANSEYEIVELVEVAEVISGQSPNGKFYNQIGDGTPFYQGKTEFNERIIGEPKKWTTQVTKTAYKEDILMSVRAPVGPINYATQECCIGRGLAAIRVNDKIHNNFLFNVLKSKEGELKGGGGSVFDSISRKQIERIQIPLPPLSVQEEIVAEIEGCQKIIDGARQVVDNYKPTIKINPDWEMVELGTVSDFIGGYAFKSSDLSKIKVSDNQIAVVKIGNVKMNGELSIEDVQYHHFEDRFEKYLINVEDILIAMTGATVGKVAISDINNLLLNQRVGLVRAHKNKISQKYIYHLLRSDNFYNFCQRTAGGGAQGNISPKMIGSFQIPLPPLSIQQEIVAQIEAEQEMVNANKKLITIYDQKIKDKINEVWGD